MSSAASRWGRGLYSRRWRRATSAAWGLSAVAAACAPSQSFRPAGALDFGRNDEIGLAFSSVGPRPYIDETTQYLGQAWWSKKLAERWDMSVLGAFDEGSAAAGVALRFDLAAGRWAALGAEIEAGLFWGAVSVPVSFRLWRNAALYTAPRLGMYGPELTPFLPVGVSLPVADTLALRAEAQVSWAGFEYYNRRVHWGLAIAHQW